MSTLQLIMFGKRTISQNCLLLIFLNKFLITTVASEQDFCYLLPAHSTLGLFLHSNKASGGKVENTQRINQLLLKSQLFNNRQKIPSMITEQNRATLEVTGEVFWVCNVMTRFKKWKTYTWITHTQNSPWEICEPGMAEAFLIWPFAEAKVSGVRWGQGKKGLPSISHVYFCS